MFMFVLSFYLYSMAVKDGCSMLTVEWKASDNRTMLSLITSVGEKREQICLLLFTCNHLVSLSRGFLFLWVLGMGYVILLWHSLSLPYNHFVNYNPF